MCYPTILSYKYRVPIHYCWGIVQWIIVSIGEQLKNRLSMVVKLLENGLVMVLTGTLEAGEGGSKMGGT